MFDALCPVESRNLRRRLCVVLVTRDSRDHDQARATLRAHVLENTSGRDAHKLRYAYIFRDKQTSFVYSLTAGTMLC